MMAKTICGCYRRDEAQNPEVFAAALEVVLGDFPKSVVEYAADPRTGVVTEYPMGLPNIGQIKVYLDDVQARQDRLKRYAELPKSDFKRLPKPPPGPGAFANVFVPANAPQYRAMIERAKAADPREWRHDEDGIWVGLGWFDGPSLVAKHFKVPTDENLRELYPKRAEQAA